ncbi:hypothetical protein [Parachryseolinea silvisoli]|uniref:hypothetical protein n=1 Tax=Parachryseolinea silvisoli TaxID=2873601 RepID=UPI002265FA1B|nr:hypothetical protein [Parachryseolinea silvisoli]MCD9015471.1 hypothetical protein [Parachryseolinea silvisoli]
MKRASVILMFVVLACTSRHKPAAVISNNFFNPGELSKDPHADTIMAKHFAQTIRSFGDSSIRQRSQTVRRLTILSPVIGGTCMISVVKHADSADVSFSRRGDRNGTDKLGLSALSFSYSTKSAAFDSMFKNLEGILIKANQELVNNPEIPEQVGDGEVYLFEQVQGGKYQVWMRLAPGYGIDAYPDIESFTRLCESMTALIPDCILPPPEKMLDKKGVLFPVFEKAPIVAE